MPATFTDAELRLLHASDATMDEGWDPIRIPRIMAPAYVRSNRRHSAEHSCRLSGYGLGALTYDEIVGMMARGRTGREIADACGVALSSLSRWRAVNGFVLAWVRVAPT